jgi:hypothetical protein
MNYTKLFLFLLFNTSISASAAASSALFSPLDRTVKTAKNIGTLISKKKTEIGRKFSESARDLTDTLKSEAQETLSDFHEAYEEVRETIAPNTVKKQNFLATIEDEHEREIAEYILESIERSGLFNYLVKRNGCFQDMWETQFLMLLAFYGINALEKFDTRDDVTILDNDLDTVCQKVCERVYTYMRNELVSE